MSKDQPGWREQLRPRALTVQRVFQSENGKELMEMMEKQFQRGTLMGNDMNETAYAIGQFELVEYLKELRDLELKDE